MYFTMELPSSTNCKYQSINTGEEPIRYRVSLTTLLRRFRKARKCISSKNAWVLLTLNFNVFFLYFFWYPPIYLNKLIPNKTLHDIVYNACGVMLHLLCPLAGILADNKIGRHNMIKWSTRLLVPGILFAIATAVIAILKENSIFFNLVIPIFSLVVTMVFFTMGIAGFEATSIQFGIDQLLDSTWEDQSIFIYWLVWVWYLSYFINFLYGNFMKAHLDHVDKDLVSNLSSSAILIILLVSTLILLFLTSNKQRLFLTDLRRHNPFKLVYKVTKFSRLHKVPVNRSAFTYCEDELPSGLDLGKRKYGGPFTIEEVEDVKAFYGILKVIFITGPSFLMFVAFIHTNDYFRLHFSVTRSNYFTYTPINTIKSALIENLAVFIVPLYLIGLRPFISYYIPSMLKRMAVGIIVPTLLPMIYLVLDSIAHAENKTLQCMFSLHLNDTSVTEPKIATYISQYYDYISTFSITASELSRYVVHVAQFEFICSQSPHTMKGLLIGLSFGIEGLFSFLGNFLPFMFHYSWQRATFPSCCMTYFLIHIILGLLVLSLYVYVTRGYQYRMRDEPCHIHRYVEEYYSKLQEEDNY